MKVQTLYAIAGLVWGLVLGPDAGLFAARVMGSVAWLYQYENGAWADWIIVPFGAVIGLTVLFSCYQAGTAAGRQYDNLKGIRLRHTKSLPWVLVVTGVVVGTITVLTVEERQRAVVDYLQAQKDAAQRLFELVENVHRITGYDVDWPGGGKNGQIDLSFSGKRRGDYRLNWRILSAKGKGSLLGGSYTIRLSQEYKRTNIPINAAELANAYIVETRKSGASVVVDERFRLELDLIPILNSRQWAQLPEGEAERLEDGDSFLLRRTRATFKVQFELRGGRVYW